MKKAAKIPLEYRMYSLVMYNISDKQKGIQGGHGKDEFERVYGRLKGYKQWLKTDKTVILLDGGTSNRTGKNHYNNKIQFGSMEQHLETLKKMGVKCMPFYEPDLNNSTAAVSFLVDSRVWDRTTYPEFEYSPETYNNKESIYVKTLGGKQNYELRKFLKNFRLA